MAEALTNVERVARQHGYRSPRRPEATESDVKLVEERCGFEIPLDLRTFLLWHDPDLWSHFVNPEGTMTSDHPTITTSGEVISREHELDRLKDVPSIRECSGLYGGRATVADVGAYFGYFAANQAELGRPESWSTGRIVVFGDSGYFEPLVYLVDATDSPAGAIVTFTEGEDDRMWLADSLAAWLARLAACDGVEYAFTPGSISDLKRQVRKQYVREFREHNHRSSWFSDA
jgi:cell wall assembly regulator SMI1